MKFGILFVRYIKLVTIFLGVSYSYATSESDLANFKNIARYQNCSSVISTVHRDYLDKIILSAGLMTDSKLLFSMIDSKYQGELTQFVKDVITFCELIPESTFKDITDKML